MNTLLLKLCDSELCAESKLYDTPRYRELGDEILKNEETLKKTLSLETFRQIHHMFDLHIEQLCIERDAAFEQGTRIGALLMLELLSDEDVVQKLFHA